MALFRTIIKTQYEIALLLHPRDGSVNLTFPSRPTAAIPLGSGEPEKNMTQEVGMRQKHLH